VFFGVLFGEPRGGTEEGDLFVFSTRVWGKFCVNWERFVGS
jgi:hypothetical protein